MDYTLALRFFAVMLTVLCLPLATLMVRRDPLPASSTIRIDALPRAQWPAVLTRTGIGFLLASFVLLLMACCLLLD
ncbi:hypothetical protein [Paraburkholderia sp. UCT2]|uniref:hypothetical protein n=1 Tax=Paraburkholderia sp. UCT2 TaxID=2615208 RepID=UPI0016550CAE|nr:hypothetical protein [Paraburkholderia sp. UCT2]MBC8732856.1 hypothetical protein [Paraburkholderia sp. UCT2]